MSIIPGDLVVNVFEENGLTCRLDNLINKIEPYGDKAIRVRQSVIPSLPDRTIALLPANPIEANGEYTEKSAVLTCGDMRAEVDEGAALLMQTRQSGASPCMCALPVH